MGYTVLYFDTFSMDSFVKVRLPFSNESFIFMDIEQSILVYKSVPRF